MALHVDLATQRTEIAGEAALTVHVKITGGAPPFGVTLFVDGRPTAAWQSLADVYEFRLVPVDGFRRALTARVVDQSGQWGASSAVIDPEPASAIGDRTTELPRVTLRSSVRSRPHVGMR